MTASSTEFSISLPRSDRRTPFRWILSHTVRQWPVWLAALIGAFGNAALAAVTPMYYLGSGGCSATTADPGDVLVALQPTTAPADAAGPLTIG